MRVEGYPRTLAALVGLYLVVMGFLFGTLYERFRFDRRRDGVLRSYRAALTELHGNLMAFEHASQATAVTGQQGWRLHLERMDRALRAGDPRQAALAWREAYGMTLGSRRWDDLAELGEAALRVGDVPDLYVAAEAARRASLGAFFLARRAESVDGMLRSAAVFDTLGDSDVVEECLRVAKQVAERHRDGREVERVETFGSRLGIRRG
jgi:hypothetical protein